jgi:hypothetical protein
MADYGEAFNRKVSCQSCQVQGQDVSQGTCPLWMADGRSFGDVVYKPRCQQQYEISSSQNQTFASSFDYRQYLIQNADALMKDNSAKASIRLQDW